MELGPTANLVSGRLVACYSYECEIYQEGAWQHLQDTTVRRQKHSSATTAEAVLLIGGDYPMQSDSTEWIPVDGSAAQPGPFTIRHGYLHCTIELGDDILVVTGGYHRTDPGVWAHHVTEYHLDAGTETPLSPLGQPRYGHACGVYQDAEDHQVSKGMEKTKQIHKQKDNEIHKDKGITRMQTTDT